MDQAHFAAALKPETTIPPELADCPRPILGFFGLVHEWLDLDLIAALARKHPEWTIALIGKASVDVSRLQGIANIESLGRKPYASLPSYCKGMSVGLIPFAVNELTKAVDPIKLREYLSAGLPVVSTAPLPRCRPSARAATSRGRTDEFSRRANVPSRRTRRRIGVSSGDGSVAAPATNSSCDPRGSASRRCTSGSAALDGRRAQVLAHFAVARP